MHNFLQAVAKVLLAPLMFLTSFAYPDVEPQLGAALPQAVAVFETSLAAPISSSATSMTLTANAIRGGGALAGYNCFTVDEGSAQAEVICGTVSSTAVSGLSRGISYSTGTTTVATNQFAHRRGANVKITDFPIVQILKLQNNGETGFPNKISYDATSTVSISADTDIPHKAFIDRNYISTSTTQSITGEKTFSATTTLATTTATALTVTSIAATTGTVSGAPSSGSDIANKTYVDGVAIAGASDAATTTKGIVEEATLAEVNSFASVGATGAKLFVTPATLASSSFASSTGIVLYNATSSTENTTITINNISMGAGDKLVVNYLMINPSSSQDGIAYFRASNQAATTTVVSFTNTPTQTAMYAYTATTTVTVNLQTVPSDGTAAPSWAQIFATLYDN